MKVFFNKKNKGITLIALIITIIILLILAGISISILNGENGILERAKQSKEEYFYAQAKEEIQIAIMDVQSKKIIEDKNFSINEITFSDLNKSNKNIVNYDETSHKGIYSSSNKNINFFIDENLNVIFDRDGTQEKKESWQQLIEIAGLDSKNYDSKENALSDTTVLNAIKNSSEALKMLSKDKELFDIVYTNDDTIDDELIKIGIVPVMTSHTTPSPFKISANSEASPQMAYYAFNQVISSQQTLWWHTDRQKPVFLEIDMGQKTQISSFTLTAPNLITSMPKNFTLEGSNDGENWDVIKTYTDFNEYKPYGTTLFKLDKTENYRYYKINITENNGYGWSAIYEIQFYN